MSEPAKNPESYQPCKLINNHNSITQVDYFMLYSNKIHAQAGKIIKTATILILLKIMLTNKDHKAQYNAR